MLRRVYARLSPDPIIRELEQAAAQAALVTVALSRSDADYIAQHYLPEDAKASSRPQVNDHLLIQQTKCVFLGYRVVWIQHALEQVVS